MSEALWGGRFEREMDDLVKQFNASISFDSLMYAQDIEGSKAHATMLAKCGIISAEDRDAIIKGLDTIREQIENGDITFTVNDEDIHMGIESRLTELIGEPGKRLHTARSRNDQCQVDLRMFLRERCVELSEELTGLLETILRLAEEHAETLWIGFTHLQHAQPVTLGFVLMAYFQMFRRDLERLLDCAGRMNLNPLGACALAGTTFPIDRLETTEQLNFAAPTQNAMDSVSDRDYVIEFLSCASISMMHLSRWAEEFAWWNSQEFSFITLDDSYATGSSIMPQKKNPDMAELVRGKVGRVYGDLMQMLTMMKGTPLAYNKDFQEDKESLFDAVFTWQQSLAVFRGMLEKTTFETDNVLRHMEKGFLNATDVAEHLAQNGIPFREAHGIVGRMVRASEEKSCNLESLSEEDLKGIDPRLTKELLGDISIEACVRARTSFGGTAPDEVRRQITEGKHFLENDELVKRLL